MIQIVRNSSNFEEHESQVRVGAADSATLVHLHNVAVQFQAAVRGPHLNSVGNKAELAEPRRRMNAWPLWRSDSISALQTIRG